jgi:phosphohistidine phosphatase
VKLLLIRHAAAVPRDAPGIDDAARPLTKEGESRFREAARGLASLVDRPDLLLTSPWLRARQTAVIAAAAWGGVDPQDAEALAGGSFAELATLLDRLARKATVAAVGHEPHLSALLARLLGSSRPEGLGFKKGGAALVELAGRLEDGGALVFFLPPKVLRRL